MQHEDDPTKFAIVERFMHKDSSQEEHLSNPYWKVSSPRGKVMYRSVY